MDGITFRTTDGGRWGAGGGTGSGGNLSPTQFDENNWEFLTRLQALENDPPVAVSIDHFTVIGSQLMIYLTDATTRGPFTLPIAAFRDVGDWTNDTPYFELDVVSVPHRGLFLVRIGHTTPASPAEFDPTALDTDSGSPTFGLPLYQQMFGEDVYIYDIGFFMPGTPGIGIETGAEMFAFMFDRTVIMNAGLAGSLIKIKAACTATMTFPLYKNATLIGTAGIAAGQTVGTYTFAADVEFDEGDVFSVLIPSTGIDATAKGLKMTIRANRTDI